MDLEARSLQADMKAVLLAKLKEYRFDLNHLKNKVKTITSPNANQSSREELLESGMADTLTVWLIGIRSVHFFKLKKKIHSSGLKGEM